MSYYSSEKPCIVCGDPVNMYRKGNFNYTKVPICDSKKKPQCGRIRKTQLQKERREANRRAQTPHAFVRREPDGSRVRWDSYWQRCGHCDQLPEHPAHRAKPKHAGGGRAKRASLKHTPAGAAVPQLYTLQCVRAGRTHYRSDNGAAWAHWTKYRSRAHHFTREQAIAAKGRDKSKLVPVVVKPTRSTKPQRGSRR